MERRDTLAQLSRRELQTLAKKHGIKANMKSVDIIDALIAQEELPGWAVRELASAGKRERSEDAAPPLEAEAAPTPKRKRWESPAPSQRFELPCDVDVDESPVALSSPAAASEPMGSAEDSALSPVAPSPAAPSLVLPSPAAPPAPAAPSPQLEEAAAEAAAAAVPAEEFFAGLHRRVSAIISSPCMKLASTRDPKLRASLSSLSSTLQQAVAPTPPAPAAAVLQAPPSGGHASERRSDMGKGRPGTPGKPHARAKSMCLPARPKLPPPQGAAGQRRDAFASRGREQRQQQLHKARKPQPAPVAGPRWR
jgi:hypothetical protein